MRRQAAVINALTTGPGPQAATVEAISAGTGVAQPHAAGEALVIELPVTHSRSLDAYGLYTFTGTTGQAW